MAFVRQRNLQPLLRVVATIALLSTAVVARSALSAGADSHSSDPYAVTPAVDTNPAPNVFETTLVAKTATRHIGNGVMANMWTYNGTVPGPELRLKVGDTVIVHYRNELPAPSGVHWHGIELNNASDGSALTQNAVPPGGSFLYKFIVPRPGIFWYHPHHYPINQVFRGLYGSLVVTDPHDGTLVTQGVLPGPADTRTLVLSDATVCKEPGTNDLDTYDDDMPWAGFEGQSLPEQPGATPAKLCDTPVDEHGNPIVDSTGNPIPLAKGDIPNIQTFGHNTLGRTNEGQTVLTNGSNAGHRDGSPEAPGNVSPAAKILDVRAGQGLRFQVVNAATTRYIRLHLTDSEGTRIDLVRVGGEGGLLNEARLEGGLDEGIQLGGVAALETPGRTQFDTQFDEGEIVLSPSDRADIVIAVPREASQGVATLWTLDYHRSGEDFAELPTVPVMHLNVTAPGNGSYTIAPGSPLRTHPDVNDPVEDLRPAPSSDPVPLDPLQEPDPNISPLLDPATFTSPKPGSANGLIEITTNGEAEGPAIDDVRGNHETAGVDYTALPHTASTRYARLGDLLDLTIANRTSAHHAFHLHGFSFQPISFTKLQGPNHIFEYPEFADTVDIPPQYTLRFRVRLEDRPQMDGVTPGGGVGRWVFHCHLFHHATRGMHAELVVLDADGNEKPNVNADTTLVALDQGGSASATGTFSDPDGDAVTLSASEGTVADIGGGRWSWSYAASEAPVGSRTVHITATDSSGLRSQAAFDLDIDNVAPDVRIIAPPAGSSYSVGSTVTVSALISDAGASSAPSCRFDWDDGAGAGAPVAAAGGVCSDSRSLSQPGVFTVVVTGSDGDGGTDTDSTMIVAYDPAGGFITGNGTTESGQAAFDVAVRYMKGSTTPVGSVVYHVQATGFDFAATGYQWLVVAGNRAQVRGSGTVGGVGGYEFLLTTVDGSPDRLGLRVWQAGTGTVVYDNAPGSPDDIDTAAPPPITLGSIVLHR